MADAGQRKSTTATLEDMKVIVDELKKLIDHGWSRTTLADARKVSYQTMSNWIDGRRGHTFAHHLEDAIQKLQ